MRILNVVFLMAFIVQQCVGYANEPEEEFRAVWLTTYAGLDWPLTHDTQEQKQSLLEILDTLERKHFNAIIFQVRARGDAFYRSSFEPWARELTGRIGEDPGWDPLAFLIKHAHARGIEVHAWFNMYKVWGAMPVPYDTEPPHILEVNPGWAQVYENEWWLDPGEPGVQTYLMKVALDLIERYPIDGIHFDHIRYPGRDFDDAHTFERFGGSDDIHNWRRDNITDFVREFYQYAAALRPGLKIGSAPMGVYRSVAGFYSSTAYGDYYQDAERWLRECIHDYIVPQIYWNATLEPRFDVVLRDWKQRKHGRHIYAGIGAFRPDILNELSRQISITRLLNIPGQVYFRYSHLVNPISPATKYKTRAKTPDMRWKENRNVIFYDQFNEYSMHDTAGTLQELPVHLRYAMYDNNRHNPHQDTSNLPQRFVIYRSINYPIDTNNPDNLLAVLPATTVSFIDEMHHPARPEYYYLVSTLNEIEDVSNIASLLDRELVFPLFEDPHDPGTLYLTMYLPRGMSVSVNITDDKTRDDVTIIEGYLDAGFHTVSIIPKSDSPYIKCSIRAGDRIIERILKRTR